MDAMKTRPFQLLTTVVACLSASFSTVGCRDGTNSTQAVQAPTKTFKDLDEAFDAMLNSKDPEVRRAANLYLKKQASEKKEDHETIVKSYGTLLFKVSHPPARRNIYESMGVFGGSDVAAILTAYLEQEESVQVKLDIIRSLGEIGPEAADRIQAIELVTAEYVQVSNQLPKNDTTSTLQFRTRVGTFEVDLSAPVSADVFQQVAQTAIVKIKAKK